MIANGITTDLPADVAFDVVKILEATKRTVPFLAWQRMEGGSGMTFDDLEGIL